MDKIKIYELRVIEEIKGKLKWLLFFDQTETHATKQIQPSFVCFFKPNFNFYLKWHHPRRKMCHLASICLEKQYYFIILF